MTHNIIGSDIVHEHVVIRHVPASRRPSLGARIINAAGVTALSLLCVVLLLAAVSRVFL